MNSNLILEIENLCLERGERILVQNLSLKIASGNCLLLRGENGAGKSTLLKAITGFHVQKSGEIRISQENKNQDYENKEFLSYLGHIDGIKPNEKAKTQLEFWADIYDCPRENISQFTLELGLNRLLHLQGGVLSAGQKRRLALARMLIQNRPIWLLDEPFSPLDENGRQILADLLNRKMNSGGIIIAAVHDTPKIENLSEVWLKKPELQIC